MNSSILISALREPSCLQRAGPRDWEQLVYEAGACQLSARVADRIKQAGLADIVPERATYHFSAVSMVCDRQHADVAKELRSLRRVLCSHGLPFLLLKGGAYIAGGLKAGQGRTLSDIDILVRKDHLDRVERQLDAAGWVYLTTDSYDQDYYRRWMHELPPMMHRERQSVLDVHHTVTPPTSAMAVEGARIFEHAQFGGLTGDELVGLPMPADLVLHSAVHLFNDSEFTAGLRDLSDLDLLFREFGVQEDFWPRLLDRARELGLTTSLYFAVTLARAYFTTPIPQDIVAAVEAMAPSRPVRVILMRLFNAVLSPPSPAGESLAQQLAAFALYVRGHGLRMPLTLLMPHLLHKAIRRMRGNSEQVVPA